MKEKRYYCDLMMSKCDEKSDRLTWKVLFISLAVVTVISSVIYYTIFMHNHGEDLEAYSESAYEYLDEIANNVISKDGINVAAIPEDVVEYEIKYKDSEIVFTYYLDNNREKEWATSANMTVTLSKDFEILSKEPNFSSREDYVKSHKTSMYMFIPFVGFITWCVIGCVYFLIVEIAIQISKIHKKMNMKKNLS